MRQWSVCALDADTQLLNRGPICARSSESLAAPRRCTARGSPAHAHRPFALPGRAPASPARGRPRDRPAGAAAPASCGTPAAARPRPVLGIRCQAAPASAPPRPRSRCRRAVRPAAASLRGLRHRLCGGSANASTRSEIVAHRPARTRRERHQVDHFSDPDILGAVRHLLRLGEERVGAVDMPEVQRTLCPVGHARRARGLDSSARPPSTSSISCHPAGSPCSSRSEALAICTARPTPGSSMVRATRAACSHQAVFSRTCTPSAVSGAASTASALAASAGRSCRSGSASRICSKPSRASPCWRSIRPRARPARRASPARANRPRAGG